jgi:hypothetical protein|uniref:Uncharacterized protein n=1 Tax=Leviviridae sp. TaxID=2027243 RepID=A0A514D0K8_9VIRU|nr:MAG: hypothetical protein H1Bulk28FD73_000003 [Leviviridae sp.]
MTVAFTARSPLINSGTFEDGNTGLPSSERILGYVTQASPNPMTVERVKASRFFDFTRNIWYWYECFNYRGFPFYISPYLDLSGLQRFYWRVITPDRCRIRHLYLSCSVMKKGRRLEGKTRLPFTLAEAIRPMIVIDGEEPSWAIRRISLLGRVRESFNDSRYTYTKS